MIALRKTCGNHVLRQHVTPCVIAARQSPHVFYGAAASDKQTSSLSLRAKTLR